MTATGLPSRRTICGFERLVSMLIASCFSHALFYHAIAFYIPWDFLLAKAKTVGGSCWETRSYRRLYRNFSGGGSCWETRSYYLC
ncbi:hypothetical protein [Laspinema olomoucense]|uniref:hypothetical protein n=1 Tax=Laspinema olomoucense TaxID=3231600 RepID=UPI0021BB96A0|nr:hypothetical protein [Laspinema sp. D3d]MCT7975342.1 hypothetical protein [Laspinema sp. D3d]MCT7988761.1 hypothetical protein [Laspinema sp. D3a]